MSLIFQLFDRKFLENFLLHSPVKAVLVKTEPYNLVWTVFHIILLQNVPCLLFSQMMDDKMLSNVLTLCQLKPSGSPRMLVDKRWQVIQFVFHNPQVGIIISPKLTVSNHLFLHVNFCSGFDSSRRQCLSFRRCLVNFHLMIWRYLYPQ